MKIAYLILGHTAPLQIVRTIERLRAPGTVFVVHIDARVGADVFEPLAAFAAAAQDVLLASRQSCYWGTYGIVAAEFACISALLASKRAFDYAVLLSGQDYPIKSNAAIAEFFAARLGAQFIEAFKMREPNRWTAQGGRFQALARVLHWTFTWRSKTFHLPNKRRFYNGWEPFGGSQWWCLTRECVEWIDRYRRANPKIERYFRRVFIPDEAMIQTMLGNSPFAAQITTEKIHYVDWERPNPRFPRTLDDEDFDRVAAASELFGRKFHENLSAGLMERVDTELSKQPG